jgi:Tfp pilus assembly protein PilO
MNTRSTYLLLGVLLVIVAAGGAGLWFGFGYLTTLKEKEVQLRQDIASESNRATRLQLLKNTFDRASSEKDKLSSYFFNTTEEDWLRFAEEVDKIVLSSGAKTEVMIGQLSAEGKPFTAELKFIGTWEQAYRLLALIENYPSRILLRKFTVQADGASRDVRETSIWRGEISFDLISVHSAQ